MFRTNHGAVATALVALAILCSAEADAAEEAERMAACPLPSFQYDGKTVVCPTDFVLNEKGHCNAQQSATKCKNWEIPDDRCDPRKFKYNGVDADIEDEATIET